jgi:hypothetical protein
MWFRRLLVFSALPLALWPSLSRADGSCTWSDVTPILDTQPGLRSFLEESFNLSPGGSAMRLDKQFESLEGKRVGPYTFDATSRKDPKLALELVIETKPEFIGETGAILPAGQEISAVVVREKFAAIRLQPSQEEGAPAPASGLPEPLIAERINWTQARCNQLNLADLQVQTVDFPEGAKLSGKAIYHHDPLSNRLEYFTADASVPGGKAISESFYFHEGELIFVLRRLTSAMPNQPGTEFKFYLQNGEIVRATRRALLPAGVAAPPAMEETLAVAPEEAASLLVRVSRLALAPDSALLVEEYATALP